MPNFTYTRDIPNGPNNPSADQPIMQTNANSTDSLLDIDLYGFNDNNGGFHQKSTYVVQGSDPTPLDTDGAQGIVYTKDVGGIAELFVNRFGSATPVQLTNGPVSAAANGYSYLPGGILLQWGSVVATPAGTTFNFPKAFSSAVFSVTLGMRAAGAQSSACAVPGLTSVLVYTQSGSQTVYVMAIGV